MTTVMLPRPIFRSTSGTTVPQAFPAHLARTLLGGTLVFVLVLLRLLPTNANAQELTIQRSPTDLSYRLKADVPTSQQVLEIDWSLDLKQWTPYVTARGTLHPHPLPTPFAHGYFRLGTRLPGASDDWTNQLDLHSTDFFSVSFPGAPPFAKFTLDLKDEAVRVTFQDSTAHPFHYPFIVSRIPGYEDLTLQDFERLALFREDQELLLGSVLLAPDQSIREAAIQFVGNEIYPVEQIADWFETVEARIHAGSPEDGTPWRLFYMPSFEQREATWENETFFVSRGIRIDSPSRWLTSNVCYSSGWAFGRLVFVSGSEIHQAFGEGRLGNEDILLTDALPAEIPTVAGVITLAPATPNSHVAILARSLNLPFAFASGEAVQEQLKSLVGREILLQVAQDPAAEPCDIHTTDTTGKLTPQARQKILDLKKPLAPTIRPKRPAGTISVPVETLTPDAIDIAGGKAAHLSLLREAIPGHSPSPAIALTFDLWDSFLDQPFRVPPLGEPTSLRQAIGERLSGTTYPPDLSRLRPALTEIRTWIRDHTAFSDTAESQVLEVLEIFDSHRKIRFRSSTNVEDSDAFSGAGLYDSASGCAADDTDTDEAGPSHCDPLKTNERGVFRALRRVYASFYNENAFIERLRHGIDEDDVGMAILVHHSFPDVAELANGVATVEILRSDPNPGPNNNGQTVIQLVTQLGAESVTNPDVSKRPEIVERDADGTLRRRQFSGLTSDEPVMDWPDDYEALTGLLRQAADAFESQLHEPLPRLVLDLEYKKMKSAGLIVKQIRAIPQLPHVPPPTLDFR